MLLIFDPFSRAAKRKVIQIIIYAEGYYFFHGEELLNSRIMLMQSLDIKLMFLSC